jgi:hypothetical protein
MTDDRRATRWRSPDEPCLNCGDPTKGKYCPTCGQRKAAVLLSLRAMLADVLEDQLVLNPTLPRSLAALLFHPGKLTEQYVRGRIVHYVSPFRLYLVSSIVFFLILSFIGLQRFDAPEPDTNDAPAAADSVAAAAVAELEEQQRALAAIDTTGMPEPARAALRETMAEAAAALAGLRASADSAAAPAGDETPDSAAAREEVQDSAAARQDTAASAEDPSEQELSTEDSVSGDTPRSMLQPWARNVTINGPPIVERAVQRRIADVGHLPPQEALRETLRDLLEYAPHMVFLLLPVFALLLKLLYIRRDRLYAEHFVFALHVHAFVFVVFIVMFILPWEWFDRILLLWIATYVWLALKRVYRQGWVRTTLKWWTLGWMYFWVLLFGLIGLAAGTLLLT